MNAIQQSTILYALRRLHEEVGEDYPDRWTEYDKFMRERHGEDVVSMSPQEISGLGNDIRDGQLPIIVLEIKDGPRIYANTGRVIVIDMDSGPQETNVPEEGGQWVKRNVYRPTLEPIPDYAYGWAELICQLMPEESD